jgi:hypothetical protein
MTLEMREMHKDSVESTMSCTLALFRFVEEVEIIGEEVVEVVGGGEVVGGVCRGPCEESGNCVTVSFEGAGGVGCLDEVA